MAAACSQTGVARARLLALALFALVTLSAPGAGPSAKRQDPRDVLLTIYARRALLADKELGALELFVRVDEGVATLSGPVPSREMGEHAVAVVKKVEGIREVRNDLSIVPPRAEQALSNLLAGLGALPGGPALLPSVPGSGLSDPGSGLGGALAREAPAPEVFSAHTDVAPPRPVASQSPVVSLGAPVALAPDRTPAVATLGSPRTATLGRPVGRSGTDPADPSSAVERLRDGDARYRNIQFEVREGVILLSGFAARPEYAIELAGAVSRLPGVRRVDAHLVRTWP